MMGVCNEDILHPEEKYVQLIQNVQKRQQIPPSAQEIVVYRGLTEGEPENRNVTGLVK